MNFQTISSEEQVRDLFEEWRALQSRAGRCFFTDPAFFAAWWDTHGRSSKRTLHVTIGREQGRLVALAPLVVMRRYGLRFLEWAGANVFDYSDTLLDSPADAELLWRAIRSSGRYDIGFIRGVRVDSSCSDAVARFGHPSRRITVYRLDMAWTSKEAWMAEALSKPRRQHLRRKQQHLEREGVLGFRVHRSGPVPAAVLDALVQQKAAWALG
jgi:CelD/BcsL family acetyltransferase involved in cellulose biosynthesis